MFSPHVFRANDIRGKYPEDFDLSFTKDLAYALCKFSQQKKIRSLKILVGMDARLSSPEISLAFIQSLKAQGASVTFIGLAPAPLCYFLLQHYNLTACVVVTASHNPLGYNGFKVLFHKKYKCFNTIRNLKSILLKAKKPYKKVFRKKGSSFKLKKEQPYISSLKKEFSLKALPFVVDTGNGALGPLAKRVYGALGLKPLYLFNKPDGRFPHHHPDPTVEKNLSHLKKVIQQKGFDFGFGFDGDGDRLVLVNHKGESLCGDELGYLFLKSLSIKIKKPLILADVKCSDWFFDWAKKQNLKVKMTKSGHGLMREQIKKTGALLALEFSGHIFFNDKKDRGFDDALYASLRLIELLKGRSLACLLPKILSARTREIRLDMPRRQITKNLSKIKAYLKTTGESFKKLDGIRLSRKKSWALFRGSKTQEALVMRFEAQNKKKLLQLKKEFAKVMDLTIP